MLRSGEPVTPVTAGQAGALLLTLLAALRPAAESPDFRAEPAPATVLLYRYLRVLPDGSRASGPMVNL
jgi:hypothetical protein